MAKTPSMDDGLPSFLAFSLQAHPSGCLPVYSQQKRRHQNAQHLNTSTLSAAYVSDDDDDASPACLDTAKQPQAMAAAPALVAASAFNVTAFYARANWNHTTLADLTIPQLDTVLRAAYDAYQFTESAWVMWGCDQASPLLPISNLTRIMPVIVCSQDASCSWESIRREEWDPARNLDPGINDLMDFSEYWFPEALRSEKVGAIAQWWADQAMTAPNETTGFIGDIVIMCWETYCQSDYIKVGNPDIVGIGMIVSTCILMVLTVIWSLLAFSPIMKLAKRQIRQKRIFHVRAAFVGSVDELYQSAMVFSVSVMVATFVYRYRSESKFEPLMADALSLLCSTTVLMLTPSYWQYNERRPQWAITLAAQCVTTVVLFGTHFSVVEKKASAAELACGTYKNWAVEASGSHDRDPFDVKGFRFIPVGFGLWCGCVIGALLHHPKIKGWRPTGSRYSPRWWAWVIVESFPLFGGFFALFVYSAYFMNTWKMMQEFYGEAFVKVESEWGFGQLLALFTWAPPVFTFFHIFFAGQEALLMKFPQGFFAAHGKPPIDPHPGLDPGRHDAAEMATAAGIGVALPPPPSVRPSPFAGIRRFVNGGGRNSQAEERASLASQDVADPSGADPYNTDSHRTDEYQAEGFLVHTYNYRPYTGA